MLGFCAAVWTGVPSRRPVWPPGPAQGRCTADLPATPQSFAAHPRAPPRPRPPRRRVQAGGQRLVQVVVYLNSLQPDQGGETRFFNPLLKGLAVQVRRC